MEKRDPLRELGNIPDNNEPQEATAKEPQLPENVPPLDKENDLLGKAEPYKPEIDLDVGCGSRPKGTNLRLSFLKAFDPLYESPKKQPTATEEQLLKPPIRQQLIIEDSDASDSSQLSPPLADASDDETVYVDAADFNEASNKQIGESKNLNLEDSKFYTPEKLNTTLLQDSENIPKSTSELADSESVLPTLIEPVSTSKSNVPHLEKRKLHSNNGAEQKVHSPVVVPCKKQRITEREIVQLIRFKLQLDQSEEESVAECEKYRSAEAKGKDQDFDAGISNLVEADDSVSEISDIKTDTPDKSVKESFTDKNLNSEVADEQYPELPETSEESSKVLLVNNKVEKASEIGWSSCDDYPDLPETSDESSRGLPLTDASAPKTTVKETVETSPTKLCSVPAEVEKYPELPETSDESSAELLVNKALEEVPTTEGKIISTSTGKDLILQACNLENYPDLPETSDESSVEQLVNKTFGEAPKTTEEKTFTQRDVFLEAANLEQYPDLPETSDESSAEVLANKTFDGTPKTTEKKTILAATNHDVVLQSCDVEEYPDLPETSDESSAEQLINKTFGEGLTTTEEKIIAASTNQDVVLQDCNLDKHTNILTSDELLKNRTFETSPRKTEEEIVIKEVNLPVFEVKKYPDLPETSDESTEDPLVNQAVVGTPEITKEETVKETVKLPETSEDISKVIGESSKSDEGKEVDKEVIKEVGTPEITKEETVKETVKLPETSEDISKVIGESSKSDEGKEVDKEVIKEVGTPEITKEETVKETVKLPETSEDISKVIGESSKSDEGKKVDKEVIKEPSKEELSQNIEVEKSKEVFTLSEEQCTDITSSSENKPSLKSTGEEPSAEKLEQVFPIQLEENTVRREISTEEVKFDIKGKKEFINSSTKLQTGLDTEEEHKSEQEIEENTNTSFDFHKPAEKEPLDSGVDSNEESYCKSPESPVVKREKSSDYEKHFTEECTVESDGQVTSDDDTDTISGESVQNDQTDQVIQTHEKIKTEDSQENLNTNEEKSEADSGKSIKNKIDFDVESLKSKMADLSEKLSEQQQENSDLKLQLNASQQAKASLELEIRQKEEIIIKTQAEAMKNEQMYKQEIKQLREKLKENSKLIEKDSSKELEEQLKEAKARETKAVAELNQRNKDDLNYQKIMEEYENTIATRFADYQKLKEEHETATRHLANIEFAFSDVHQKYERTKTLLEGYKSNEETLVLSLQASEKTCKQHEERYESLKAHAKAQIEKSNKEILMLRDKYEMDINKLKAIIKRLEIKCGSLEVSLQQKHEECAALSALCDEVTGKRM